MEGKVKERPLYFYSKIQGVSRKKQATFSNLTKHTSNDVAYIKNGVKLFQIDMKYMNNVMKEYNKKHKTN